MNREELRTILTNSNMPGDLYSLHGGLPNEVFCLNNDNDYWEVYYSERGIKSELTQFELEKDACENLLERISKVINLQF